MSNNDKKDTTPNNELDIVYGQATDIDAIQIKLKKQKRKMQGIFLGLFLCLGLWYLVNQQNQLTKQDYIGENIIRIRNDNGAAEGDIVICNPWRNASFSEMLLFRSLFLVDSSYTTISPSLAEKYEILEDGVTYVITMRENQFWSDGTPITVDDVLFSFEGFLSCTSVNSNLSAAFNRIVGATDYTEGRADSISGITVEGNTISITLDAPNSNFALMLTQFVPLPKHILEDTDVSTLTTGHDFFVNTNPICSGEFSLERIDENNNAIFGKNPYYTDPVSDIDTVMVCWDYDNVTIDYEATTDPTKMVSYRSMKGFVEYPIDVYYYRYFIFNLAGGDEGEENEAMEDVRVRQAIYHAIDVETLAKEIYFGKTNMIYGGSLTVAEEYCEYNPEKAKELLEEAGYDFSQTFTIAYYSGDTSSRIFIERIAEYLEEIGMKVELFKATAAELYENPTYDMLLKNLSALNTEDWYNEYLSTNANLSQLLGREGEFDELVAELTSTTNSEEYNALIEELVALEQELLYKMPMFLLSDAAYINSNRLSVPDGITFGNTRYRSDIRFDEWYVKKE